MQRWWNAKGNESRSSRRRIAAVQSCKVAFSVLAGIALAYSLITLIARALPLSNVVQLVLALGSPYVPLVMLLGLAFAILSRRAVLAIGAIVVIAVTLAIQVPWYYLGRPADVGQHVDIRVLSSNLRDGQADAPFLVRLAKETADVICVSELTPEELDRFRLAGIEKEFPYSVLGPAPAAEGIGLWSRFPLKKFVWANNRTTGAAARLRVPGVRFDVALASVHVISPIAYGFSSFGDWRQHMTATKAELDDSADAVSPFAAIVAGDFNSTPDMRQFRDLLTEGYRDAVQQTGAGFTPTFPSNTWFPPLITIDHLLTRQAAAVSSRTINVRGSDHRALLVTVEVPVDPAEA